MIILKIILLMLVMGFSFIAGRIYYPESKHPDVSGSPMILLLVVALVIGLVGLFY